MLYQDADISQEELDWLVHVCVWGEDCYELAKFTVADLVPASPPWLAAAEPACHTAGLGRRSSFRTPLRPRRTLDIKVPMGHMHIREDTVGLAKLLWPMLHANCEAEMAKGAASIPVPTLVQDVRNLVAKPNGGTTTHIIDITTEETTTHTQASTSDS